MHKKLLAACGLIAIGVAGRLVPHLPNATPVTAITLAGGRHLGRAWAIAIPIIAMLLSDAVIGWYDWRVLASVYLSFAVVGALGARVRSRGGVVALGLSASFIFFFITNFAVWAFSSWYPKSLGGLFAAYAMGLPFLRYMWIGDVFYCALILGALELYASRAALARATLRANPLARLRAASVTPSPLA